MNCQPLDSRTELKVGLPGLPPILPPSPKHCLMIKSPHYIHRGFLGGAVVKNPPANAGDARDMGLIPESGKSSGVGNGNPLQYCCLKGCRVPYN